MENNKQLVKTDLEKLNAFNIIPKSYEEAMKMCELIASSDFVPPAFKGKPANVFVAGSMGYDIGLSLLQSIQNIAVINGRPSIYGVIGKAILQKNGLFIEMPDVAKVEKEGSATVTIERMVDGIKRTSTQTYNIELAKKAKLWAKTGPWTDHPAQQMSWRAFWNAANNIAADLLKGLSGYEESIDIDPAKVQEAEIISIPKRKSEIVTAIPDRVQQTPESTINPKPEQPEQQTTSDFKLEATQQVFDRTKLKLFKIKNNQICMECGNHINGGEQAYIQLDPKIVIHEKVCAYVPE